MSVTIYECKGHKISKFFVFSDILRDPLEMQELYAGWKVMKLQIYHIL